MATVHVVGAGIAGLAAAVRLSANGRRVALYEAAPHAGGRCRSFHDRTLDRTIDNGNHLLLSANRAILAYLEEIGAADSLTGPEEAAFPFVDLATGERWTLCPNRGPLPWWLLNAERRVGGSRPLDYLSVLRVLAAGHGATVGDCVPVTHPLYTRFWEPLVLAVLNIDPARGAAAPLRNVLLETFCRGGAACRPMIPREGLSASLIAPALATLRGHGTVARTGWRLRGLGFHDDRVALLDFGTDLVTVAAGDQVVLALPSTAIGELLPSVPTPQGEDAILNVHFRLPRPPETAAWTRPPTPAPTPTPACTNVPFIGIVNGTAHWVFLRDDIASVTISSAGDLLERPTPEIIRLIWADVAAALALPAGGEPPLARVIKERRATFSQSVANQALRPAPTTRWRNLFLAGDWTATGLPATLEGAVRSGHTAAALAAR